MTGKILHPAHICPRVRRHAGLAKARAKVDTMLREVVRAPDNTEVATALAIARLPEEEAATKIQM